VKFNAKAMLRKSHVSATSQALHIEGHADTQHKAVLISMYDHGAARAVDKITVSELISRAETALETALWPEVIGE
jgi:hypothetical protein